MKKIYFLITLSILFLGIYLSFMFQIPQKVSKDLEAEDDRMYNIAVSVLTANFKAGSICTTGANFKGYFSEISPESRMNLVRHPLPLFKEELKNKQKIELLDTYKLFKKIDNPDIVNAWNLVVYELYTKLGEMTPQGIKTWEISPYAISFRVQSEDNAYSSMSIQQALDESFNWLTSNKQSQYSNFSDKYLSLVSNISNEISQKTKGLYRLSNESVFKVNFGGELKSSPNGVIKDSIDDQYSDGYWKSPYYRVYIRKNTFAEYFYIEKDKVCCYLSVFYAKRIKFYSIFYTIAFLLGVTILLVLIIQTKRRIPKPLYVRLLNSCNPVCFMKPYDEKKVTYANLLYKRLKEIDEKNNIDALMGIMEEANDKLQIHIVSKEEIENLKRKCNPKNYMKPYNSQKVDFANRLYSRLNNKKITDKDYFEIYKESKQLVNVN